MESPDYPTHERALSFHLTSKNLILCAIFSFTFLAYTLLTRQPSSLRAIPGPWVASITKLWIFQKQRGLQRHVVDIALHQKYGPIVRIAPSEVLVSSPKAFQKIYGAGSHFRKGDWYIGVSDCGWRGPDNFDLFTEQVMEKYRLQRRLVGPAYTADSMKDLEENMDQILANNVETMRKRAGQIVDVDLFFNKFASDCLATATFSKSNSLVESGKDDGSINYIHHAWKYTHLIGYFPLLHRVITALGHTVGNKDTIIKILPAIVISSASKAKSEAGHPFAFPISEVGNRFALNSSSSRSPDTKHTDIIGKLLQIQSQKPQLKSGWVSGMCMTNFGAGVETTAITVSSFIINVVSNSGCQEKIHAEIDFAKRSGKLSSPPKLREMKNHLPFMSACLSESMRLHHVVGMPLLRVVPEEGCELEGHVLPAGTTVGINPWVLGRDKSLYGEDAHIWRPERWLEYSPEHLKYLESYSISFGTGARSCPGKHLAQAIYTKMIPMLFSEFEWSFTDPDAEKVLQCTFPVRYVNLMMQWKERTHLNK